jgi:hypothetical protein
MAIEYMRLLVLVCFLSWLVQNTDDLFASALVLESLKRST